MQSSVTTSMMLETLNQSKKANYQLCGVHTLLALFVLCGMGNGLHRFVFLIEASETVNCECCIFVFFSVLRCILALY